MRTSAWTAPDGQSTSEAIKAGVADGFKAALCQSGLGYASDDMKIGIGTDTLEKCFRAILGPLVSLDVRGGFFAQLAVEGALKSLSGDDAFTAGFKALASIRMITEKRCITEFAYNIRVMLAHVRIKHKQWRKLVKPNDQARENPASLVIIYEMFVQPPSKQASRVKSENPFLSFQCNDEADNDENDLEAVDDEPVPIVSSIAMGDRVCYAKPLMSDGRCIIADKYTVDEDGFIVAHYPNTDETFNTEIMGVRLEPDGKFILRPAIPATAPKISNRGHADDDDSANDIETDPKPKGKGKAKGKAGKANTKAKGKAKAKPKAEPAPSTSLEDVMKILPLDAHFTSNLGVKKSYTLSRGEEISKISVVLNVQQFYISHVDVLPPHCELRAEDRHKWRSRDVV